MGVAWLARRGTPECIETLAHFLFDLDVDVLHEAAKALAHDGTMPAVSHLLRLACDERAALVRRVVAVFALGDVPSATDETVATLRALEGHADPWLARTARESLLRLTKP